MFLDFVGFTLPRFGLWGVHFLIFGLLHSLGLGAWERISCFFSFCTPSILALGSVILAFSPFTLPSFRRAGAYFLIFRLLHSLDSGDWECIS